MTARDLEAPATAGGPTGAAPDSAAKADAAPAGAIPESADAPLKVAAVVVAYNRRDLLAESLAAITAQSRPVDALIVIDNASDDGSAEMVADRFPHADLVQLPRNTGGAGGFAVGIERAVTTAEADLVWIMDDDTVPEPGALAALLAARDAFPGVPAFTSRAVWTDGRDHPMNVPRRSPFVRGRRRAAIEAEGLRAVRSVSFVSSLFSAAVIRRVGLPVAAYFIWNDDFEFSTRVIRRGRAGTGLYCPESVVVHKTKVFGSTDADPGARFYYEVRNKLWLFRWSSGLSPFEKVLVGAATLRRWTLTVVRSSDRAILADGLRRGVQDALWAPRPTSEELADLGAPGEAVAAFERAARGSV